MDSCQAAVTKKRIDIFKSICRNPNKPENQKKLAFAKSYLKQHGIPIPVNKSKSSSSSENPQDHPDKFEDPDIENSDFTEDQFEEIGVDEGEKGLILYLHSGQTTRDPISQNQFNTVQAHIFNNIVFKVKLEIFLPLLYPKGGPNLAITVLIFPKF